MRNPGSLGVFLLPVSGYNQQVVVVDFVYQIPLIQILVIGWNERNISSQLIKEPLHLIVMQGFLFALKLEHCSREINAFFQHETNQTRHSRFT
jgi:hypothetical protein